MLIWLCYYNAIESTTIIAEQRDPRPQQMKTRPNTTAVDTETKEKKNLLTFRTPLVDRDFQQDTLTSTANP